MRRIKENNDRHPDRNHSSFYEDSIRNLFRKNLGSSIRIVILMMLVAGIAYPLILTGIGQTILPFQSNGSVVTMDGKNPLGSILISQEFTKVGGQSFCI
jgi:K+-transporting ATPase ATPase C chain